jgi:hypothetical protein
VPSSAVVKIASGFGLALVIALTLPRLSRSGTVPPVRILVLTGALIALATTTALYLTITRDLKLPVRVAVYAVAYNALVVAVKFILAPYGVYQVNQRKTIESLLPLNDPFGAAMSAGIVFLLYVAAYAVIYRVARRKLIGMAGMERRARARRSRRIVVPLVLGSVLLAGTVGSALLLPLLLIASSGEYLDFVFSSGASLLIGIALAGATALAGLAFTSAADRAKVVGDATVFVSFFWVGLYFLALYHVLWVVYVLVLTAIWPLKVVVPK